MFSRLAAAAALIAIGTVAQAAAVAFVTDVQGEARSGNRRIAFLAELEVDQRIVLEKGARLTILYTQSGAEFTASGPAEVAVGAGELQTLSGAPASRRAVSAPPAARVVAQVAQSSTASVRMRSVPPPAPPVPPGLDYPREGRIATLRPLLRWTGAPGPKGFAIVVNGADGTPAWSGHAKASPYRLPVKLAPGARYTWNVAGARPLGEGTFETLDADASLQVEKSLAAVKGFPDKVMHAMRLQELGATADAREAWAALARERPDLPELATLAR